MKIRKPFLLALAVLCSAVSLAQTPEEEVLFREYVKTLSSDEFGGRKPMSVHEPMVMDYIVKSFKESGLQPGAADGSWLQAVPLVSTHTTIDGGVLTISGKKGKMNLKESDQVVVWTNRAVDKVNMKNLQYVFCGFGIDAPEYGWNDYEGIDVKGKVVILISGDPGFFDDNLFRGKNVTYYSRWSYKFEEARRRQAAGVLIIHNAPASSYSWQVVQSGGAGIKQDLCNDQLNMDDVAFKGWIQEDAGKELLTKCGFDAEGLIAAAKQPGFKSLTMNAKGRIDLTVDCQVGESHNVIGVLPGTDLKDECVVYSAHWDHFGIGMEVNGDGIYNGAEDNASGTAALMLLARKFAESKVEHRRSIVFVAVTAEESGLLGSQYYCENPVFPAAKTAVNINMDGMAPRERTYDIAVRGMGMSEVDKYLEIVAAAQGRELRPILVDSAAIFYRCDHFNFVKVGIPALCASIGGRFVDRARHDSLPRENYYHLPNDEYHEWWPLDGTFDDLYMYHAAGLMISNADEMPKWYPDAEFQR